VERVRGVYRGLVDECLMERSRKRGWVGGIEGYLGGVLYVKKTI
jgi:hypothetical protein